MIISCSVIIPTFRQTDILAQTLISLQNQDLKMEYDILVIDNNLEKTLNQEVRKIVNDAHMNYFLEERRGSAAARNMGVKQAKGDILVFVDDDVKANQFFLQSHIDHHLREKDLVVVGKVEQTSNRRNWFNQYIKESHIFNCPITAKEELIRPLFYGANSSVRREWVEAVGGFDERFMRRQDGELAYRLKKAGLKFIAEPEAKVEHYSNFTPEGYLKRSRANGYYLAMLWEKHPELRQQDNPGQYEGIKYALARSFGLPVYWLGRSIYPVFPEVLYKGFTARILVENAKGIRDFQRESQ